MWLAAEGRRISDGALAAIELLGRREDVGDIERGLSILVRDRGHEWRQWQRYLAPKSRIGRALDAVGLMIRRVGRWVG